MKANYSITTMWDSRAVNSNKESRIMLSVSINRERFKVSLKLYSTKSDYDKAIGGRSLTDVQKNLKADIASFSTKAETLLERLQDPSKETFLRFFKSDMNLSNGSKVDVYALFKAKRDLYEKQGQFGTAHTIRAAWYSFRSFKKELYLEDITESFLKSYKEWMMKKSASPTTVCIYFRNLRAVYYRAIEDGLISGTNKPFKNVSTTSAKKSVDVLYPAQLKALWEYRSDSIREQRSIAFFFFCYLGNGMNFKDLANLRFKNIKGDVISFVRQKTKRTRNNGEIKVHFHDAMKKVIDMWGNKDCKPHNFVFPLMNKYRNEKHFEDTIFRYKRITNKMLSTIGKELGFDVHLCLNLARHSFATKQKIDGTNPVFIKDAMGHGSLATTEHYLKSLPDMNLAQLNSRLLSFQ